MRKMLFLAGAGFELAGSIGGIYGGASFMAGLMNDNVNMELSEATLIAGAIYSLMGYALINLAKTK